jgi:hypothetical protein
MQRTLASLLLASFSAFAAPPPPIYYLLWFDTEDYIEPTSDDAALRIAEELTKRNLRATFKIVGEKARVLEQRGRTDVFHALAAHDIGYHSDAHSIHPTGGEYLAEMGLLDGAAEFERREGRGLRDLQRIFGITPSCYGQPGNSWAPQANLILRKWGVPVYMDEGDQVSFNNQPFWYGGMLYVFHLGPNALRADLNDKANLPAAIQKFDARVAALRPTGGVIHSYYHPTEFATTEFWDGVNFKYGANPPRSAWKLPQKRTPESIALAYANFLSFVDHVRNTPGIKIVTARDIPGFFAPRDQAAPTTSARKLATSIDAHDGYSPAELLLSLLGISPRYVDGPALRVATNYKHTEVARQDFEAAKAGAVAFITTHGRLPDAVYIGSTRLSLPDFAATLAGDDGTATLQIRHPQLDIESHIGKDAAKNYDWVIHPKGYAPEHLLDLARLQAWTLKPAQLR